MRAPEVVLVRHGETEWSLRGKHTGNADIPLTDAGRRQGEQVGRRLAKRRFELVLTSPLGRAAETCRLAGLGADAQVRRDLMEWDYGRFEGRTMPEIRTEEPGWDLWREGCPEGESAPDVARRAERVIAELRSLEGDAAVFAHGHLLRVVAARWLGMPPEAGRSFALSTATISILGHEHGTPVIWLWNEDAHRIQTDGEDRGLRADRRPADGCAGGP